MQENPTIVQYDSIESHATFMGHPIHPMVIVFPIAFLVAALASDLIYVLGGSDLWARGAVWLVGATVVTGAVAAVFGLYDFAMNARIRDLQAAWLHGGGNAIIIVLAIINLLVRIDDPVAGVVPWGFALSLISSVLMLATGWFGGELVYKHRVGINS